MATVLPPDVPGPNPGQPGHYAHHDYLTQSVHALDSARGVLVAVANAASLPSGSSVGAVVWQTDAKRAVMWTGTLWVPVYGRMPYCHAYQTGAGQSVAGAGATTDVILNAETEDTDNLHSASDVFLTIPYAGRWQFNALVSWGASSVGTRFVGMSSPLLGIVTIERWQPTSAGAQSQGCSWFGQCAAGDTFKVICGQTSGANLVMSTGAGITFLQAYMLGPS